MMVICLEPDLYFQGRKFEKIGGQLTAITKKYKETHDEDKGLNTVH